MDAFTFTPHPLTKLSTPRVQPASVSPVVPSRGPQLPPPQLPSVEPTQPLSAQAPAHMVTPTTAAQTAVIASAEPINTTPDPTAVSGEAFAQWAEAPDEIRRPGATQGQYFGQLFDLSAMPPPTAPPSPEPPVAKQSAAASAAVSYDASRRLFGGS